MAIYKCKIKGQDGIKVIKAPTAAQARLNMVEATPMSPDEIADFVADGGEIIRPEPIEESSEDNSEDKASNE